jgi:hypothetical protein
MRTNYFISCFYFGCPWGRTVDAPKYSPPHVQRVKERPRRNVVSLVRPSRATGRAKLNHSRGGSCPSFRIGVASAPPRDKTVPAPWRSRRNDDESSSQHTSMKQRRASTSSSSFLVEGGERPTRPTTTPVRLVSSLDGAPSAGPCACTVPRTWLVQSEGNRKGPSTDEAQYLARVMG